jgi:hypothetical protein
MALDAWLDCCRARHCLRSDLLRPRESSLAYKELVPSKHIFFLPPFAVPCLRSMIENRHADAYAAMCRLRWTRLQAARDMYYMVTLLDAEQNLQRNRNLFKELFTIPRNRRATQASALVMFMQRKLYFFSPRNSNYNPEAFLSAEFCGVNVIAYYSSAVFVQAGRSRKQSILLTMGTGLVNWVFAIPGMLTIDTFGRRNLLLVSISFRIRS